MDGQEVHGRVTSSEVTHQEGPLFPEHRRHEAHQVRLRHPRHDHQARLLRLGASLFPTAFTGYGIEFNTISCGLSALEKIGSTFISILQLVFKSKEGAEQGGGGDAEAKKEHMSPKYHESAADIKKRRAESFGGNKGSVMYKMFDGEEGRN